MKSIQEIWPWLDQPKNIVITMHQKPDGDAMGSTLALAGFLKKLNHIVTVVSPTNWPDNLNWLPGTKDVVDFEKSTISAEKLISNCDVVFCLDFNVLSRTKNMATILAETKAKRVLIDHHQQPQVECFEYGVSDTSKSSTAQMVYDFIIGSPHSDLIDSDIASCIYAGTMTDTGSFRYPSTSGSVHSMIAHLKEIGLDHSKIHENIFENYSETKLRFLGNALLNRMEVFYEYNTALIAIPASDLQKYDIKTGDTEGLVNMPLGITGIKMSAIVIDRGEERKWSFRSKGEIDVNTFARTYFNGGGHFSAAGGMSLKPFNETVEDFKKAMVENKEILSTYQF